jgi:hypothetical protein
VNENALLDGSRDESIYLHDEIEMHVPFVDFSPPRDPHPIPRLKIYPHFRALLPFPPLPLTPLAPQFKFTRERIN